MSQSIIELDTYYMQRCLQIAQCGIGCVAPNPLVGSVIVHNNIIIGEGYHRKYGEAHAEVNAICSVANPSLLQESTIYVNLEPCAHFGKTPPCSDLIIEKKIKRCVIGCIDSFSKVAGKGIEKMQHSGIEVVVGVMEQESRHINRRFFTFHEQQRPYIILKWAQTTDGFIDIANHKKETTRGHWITNDTCRSLVHRWRTEEDAILVGTNTVLNDNPALNVRSWVGRNPVRIVLDRTLRLPQTLHLFDESQKTIIFTEKERKDTEYNTFITINFSNTEFWKTVFNELYNQNIQSVIIEGGKTILDSIIAQNLWDEARIFTGSVSFGEGLQAPHFNYTPFEIQTIGNAQLRIFQNL